MKIQMKRFKRLLVREMLPLNNRKKESGSEIPKMYPLNSKEKNHNPLNSNPKQPNSVKNLQL